MALGLVAALRFTRALSNGPGKQKKKLLWTDYSRLDIKRLLRWGLSPPPVHGVKLIQGVDVNLVMSCMLPGQPLKLFVKRYK